MAWPVVTIATSLIRRVGKKGGWKLLAVIALVIVAVLGIRHLIDRIAQLSLDKTTIRETLEATIKAEKETTDRWKTSAENQEKRAVEAENKLLEKTCHTFTLEERLPDGTVRISTSEMCESTTLTVKHSKSASLIVTPPIAMPPKPPAIVRPLPRWMLGVEYWPDLTAVQADVSYRIGRRWGLGVGLQPSPFAWGIRAFVLF